MPSGFSRAMWLRVTTAPPLGASVVKSPPIRILPSGCITTTRMSLFAFGSKPSSADCPRAVAAAPVKRAMEHSAVNRIEEWIFMRGWIVGLR